MSKVGYSIVTGGAVALAAATAKTIIGIKSGAAFGLDWQGFEVGFDGVTATAVPVLVEACYCTWATNAPGTNSTTITPVQTYGRVLTHGTTAAKTWSAEPTALTPFEEFLLTPNGGLVNFKQLLGQTPDCALGEGFALRLTAPAIVNARATMLLERC